METCDGDDFKVDGSTVYVLNENGTNLFWFQVRPGENS